MNIITEHNLLIFLVQFALILGLSKLLGLIFIKWKQSTLTAEILVGLILSVTILGRLAPSLRAVIFPADKIQDSMLQTIAWLGNLYLLMETGLEINFSQVWKQRGQALIIALSDIVIPVLLLTVPMMLITNHYMPNAGNPWILSAFLAMILSISALPVTARVLYDLHILKSDFGFLIVSTLAINDVIGWVAISLVLKLLEQSVFDFMLIFKFISLIVLFIVISMTVLRKSIDKIMSLIHDKYGSDSGIKTSLVFLIGMLFGAMTLALGIHSMLGFFIAGITVGAAKHFSDNDRHVMNRMVHSIFIPVFFANIGLHLNFISSFDVRLVLVFTIFGMLIRYSGAYCGAIFAKLEKFSWNPIAICHTAGGEMHIVVAGLAYSANLISEPIFLAIVISSILSTVSLGPLLSRAIKKQRESILDVVFAQDSINTGLNFQDKEEALVYLAKSVSNRTGIAFEPVYNEIMKREERMTTAIGHGVAIPHARLEGINYPLILLVRNNTGLEWDSPDDKLVRLIFLLITPAHNEKIQLQILQALAKALSQPDLMDKLKNAANPKQLWEDLRDQFSELKLS